MEEALKAKARASEHRAPFRFLFPCRKKRLHLGNPCHPLINQFLKQCSQFVLSCIVFNGIRRDCFNFRIHTHHDWLLLVFVEASFSNSGRCTQHEQSPSIIHASGIGVAKLEGQHTFWHLSKLRVQEATTNLGLNFLLNYSPCFWQSEGDTPAREPLTKASEWATATHSNCCTICVLCTDIYIQIAPEYWMEMPHDVYWLIGREELGLSYMLHDPRSWFPSMLWSHTHTHTCRSTFTYTDEKVCCEYW